MSIQLCNMDSSQGKPLHNELTSNMESAELYKMLTSLALQVSSLGHTILELQQEVQLLKGTVRPAPEPAYPEPFVMMPERFAGSRASLLCFKMDCELLFALKPRTYATDYVKVRASINLLTGQIKSWAHQLLQEKSPVLDSWETFVCSGRSHSYFQENQCSQI
ncbi:protein LDOC1-like [Rana temporaria]|uniref:protein LDOC1-like n=1 Tax=Rana temporaria TaxID=8407 RepID=UPI001AAD59A8|nr:protein LDOC1-like [Rana temporaria]